MPSSNKASTKKKTNPKKDSKIIVDVYVPKFDDLWNNHPNILNIKACEEKNKITGDYLYDDQCAIALSYSLKKCKVNFNSLKVNKCACGYLRGAQDIANWLYNKKPFGDKVKWISINPLKYTDELEGKKGIVFFEDFWRRDTDKPDRRTGDHIDFWKSDKTTKFGSFSLWFDVAFQTEMRRSSYTKCKNIWFWEIE